MISKFEAKTEWSDFSFVELYYIKHLNETADELNEMALMIQCFLGYRCKQSRAALMNYFNMHRSETR